MTEPRRVSERLSRPKPSPSPNPGPPEHAVAIIGGAVAGSEAARVLAERGVLAVVLEQRDRPYGKIEDGLPRWHVEQRIKQYRAIDQRLDRPLVHFIPRVRLGREVTVSELLDDWGLEAVLLATGAWRDRPLPIPHAEELVGRGLAYQNPLVGWFNRAGERGYQGPPFVAPDGAVVVGGGLASIDVVKILQLELVLGALRARGIDEDLVRVEHVGIPAALERHGLRWEDLGLRGTLLIYRRRPEDMPLAWAAPGSGEEGLERVRAVRKKIMERARDKYRFRFEPCRAPVRALVEDGRLTGLEVARTEVPKGRKSSPQPVLGSEAVIRTPLVVSSIGSVPEPLPGLPMDGELYRYKDGHTGELDGFDGVYALGNVVTGQGNIQASLKHASFVAHHVVARYLGVGDALEAEDATAADVDPLLAIAAGRASSRAEAVLERLRGRPPLGETRLARLLERIQALQQRVGYAGYADWIIRSRSGG